MSRFSAAVKDKDVTLWLKLREQDIKPQYYAFRWLTLLLSQEFELPSTYLNSMDQCDSFMFRYKVYF